MLEVRGVATFYGAIQALHGVDLEVAKGEIVTLIGANGAGKSTLLMTVCGNPQARVGTIRMRSVPARGSPVKNVLTAREPVMRSGNGGIVNTTSFFRSLTSVPISIACQASP